MIVDVKDASFRVDHGGGLELVDFSVSASTGLCDYFSQQGGSRFGATKGFPCDAPEIFIDGFGTQQSLLTSPSRIFEWRE